MELKCRIVFLKSQPWVRSEKTVEETREAFGTRCSMLCCRTLRLSLPHPGTCIPDFIYIEHLGSTRTLRGILQEEAKMG
jgi:hypothetical protein